MEQDSKCGYIIDTEYSLSAKPGTDELTVVGVKAKVGCESDGTCPVPKASFPTYEAEVATGSTRSRESQSSRVIIQGQVFLKRHCPRYPVQ